MKNEKILVPVEFANSPVNFIYALVYEEFEKIFPHRPKTEQELLERMQQHGCYNISVLPNTADYWLAFCVIAIPPTEENNLWATLECEVSMAIEKRSRKKLDIKSIACLEDWRFLNERSNDNV